MVSTHEHVRDPDCNNVGGTQKIRLAARKSGRVRTTADRYRPAGARESRRSMGAPQCADTS